MSDNLTIEEYTANFTGFDAFACKGARPFIYAAMAALASINILFQIIAYKKGGFYASAYQFCTSIFGNLVMGVVIDSSYCLSIYNGGSDSFYDLNALLVGVFVGAYGFFQLFLLNLINCLVNFDNDGPRGKMLYDITKCWAPIQDDDIVNINAFIKRAYANPPVITIKGMIRSNFDYTADYDKEFTDYLEYKSWRSNTFQPIEDVQYANIIIEEEFEYTPELQMQLNEKLNYIRQITDKAYCEILSMDVIQDVPNIKKSVYKVKNSKVVKFSTTIGIVIYFPLCFMGYGALLTNIYGLLAKKIVIRVKKTLSDKDNLPGKYLQFDQTVGYGDNYPTQSRILPQLQIIESLPIELKQRYIEEHKEVDRPIFVDNIQPQNVYGQIQDIPSPYEPDPIIP